MDKLFTDEELAKALKRSRASLRRDRARGDAPPHVKIGGQVRYRESDVQQWIEDHLEFPADVVA